MKRELFQNVKALPYKSGEAIDRAGFLSAVVAATAAADGDITVAVSHCSTADGAYEAVLDKKLFVNGGDTAKGLKAKDTANFDIDLVGCKQFIKIALSGSADAGCAVVLGDKNVQPV